MPRMTFIVFSSISLRSEAELRSLLQVCPATLSRNKVSPVKRTFGAFIIRTSTQIRRRMAAYI